MILLSSAYPFKRIDPDCGYADGGLDVLRFAECQKSSSARRARLRETL
jgi:hypothetical protein